MAETTPAANPDKALFWEAKVKKITDQAEQIAKALIPLCEINRDRDGKEIKPIKDVAGLSRQTAMAIRADYKEQMISYGGSYELGEDICGDTTILRRKLNECLTLAQGLKKKAADAGGNLDALFEYWAKHNAPKIQQEIDLEEQRMKRKAEKIDRLKKAVAGKRPVKSSQAQAQS